VSAPAGAAAPPRDVTLTAADGYRLAATLHAPASGDAAGTVVVHGATGVPRRFYDRFARHLAGEGLAVLTYDYRGIGGSRPARLRGFPGTMRHWGERDAAAALAWAAEEMPGAGIVAVGHSAGGQVMPLAPNAGLVRGMLLVSSQCGWYGYWRGLPKLALAFLWHVGMPATTALLGRFPFKALGQGEDLPPEVAKQWARWCRTPHYLSDDEGRPMYHGHAALPAPVRAYSFSDDPYAPRASVDALVERYGGAQKEHLHLRPADVGARAVGHFGFFREGVGGTLWPQAAAWLRDRAASTA
jgi:predicted alpha/beta hydrolase